MPRHNAYQILAAQEFQPSGSPPTEIELLQVGDWQAPWKGHIQNTIGDFQEMINNFQNGAGKFQPDNKLPINLDHQKIEAAGWIHGLEIRGDSLWGTGIEWTPLGVQKLADKEFAYLSSEWSPVWQNPLNEEELVDNVFEGAALTNYPLFSTLQPLAASHKQKKVLTANDKNITLYMKGSVMTLAEILAKPAAELSDEEKTFVVEHKAELNEEQTKTLTDAGVLEAVSTDPEETEEEKAARVKKEQEDSDAEAERKRKEAEEQEASRRAGTTTISASKLAELEADAKAGKDAATKLRAMEASSKTQAFLVTANNKDGRFSESQHGALTTFYVSLNASQQTQFDQLVASMPKVPLGVVAGTPEVGAANSEAEDLIKQAEKLVADKKAPNFQEAMKQITASNKETVTAIREQGQGA